MEVDRAVLGALELSSSAIPIGLETHVRGSVLFHFSAADSGLFKYM